MMVSHLFYKIFKLLAIFLYLDILVHRSYWSQFVQILSSVIRIHVWPVTKYTFCASFLSKQVKKSYTFIINSCNEPVYFENAQPYNYIQTMADCREFEKLKRWTKCLAFKTNSQVME